MIRAWIAALKSELALHATERRTGISLIEAVAADQFNQDLRAVIGPESPDAYRGVALEAAKCGLRPNEANAAFTQWVQTPFRTRVELESLMEHIEGRIRRYE